MLDNSAPGCIPYPSVTALCIWEAVLFQIQVNSDLADLEKKLGRELFRQGFAEPDLIRACEMAFGIARNAGFQDTFDADWCPIFVSLMLEVNPETSKVVLRPNWLSQAWYIGRKSAGIPKLGFT